MDITVHNHLRSDDLSRGDVVEVTGDLIPMSLLQFELGIQALLSVFDEGMAEALAAIDPQGSSGMVEGVRDIKTLKTFSRAFIGSRTPLRLESSKRSAGVPLRREHLWADPARVFAESREYTVYGRVNSVIPRGEKWDPLDATSVLDRYVPDEGIGPGFRQAYVEFGREEMNLDLSDDEMTISGPSVVIEAIAVYW